MHGKCESCDTPVFAIIPGIITFMPKPFFGYHADISYLNNISTADRLSDFSYREKIKPDRPPHEPA